MKREIKFRAWDKVQKEMVFDGIEYQLRLIGHICNDSETQERSQIGFSNFDFDRFEIMQFTSLTDKNGKEIYEGDILQSDFGDGKPTPIYFGEFACSTYETKDLATQIGFYWHEEDGTKSIFGKSIVGNMDYCEVIGNIYENPELL
jgi:uncharacterized phage protein (TIGR01671 family)